jgi:hypothetical protein
MIQDARLFTFAIVINVQYAAQQYFPVFRYLFPLISIVLNSNEVVVDIQSFVRRCVAIAIGKATSFTNREASIRNISSIQIRCSQ